MSNKCVSIPTDGYYEEISSITNNVINDIEEALTECIDGKEVNIPKGKLVDCIKYPITRIYYDEGKEDVMFDTTDIPNQYLREEPITIIMDVAEYLNNHF